MAIEPLSIFASCWTTVSTRYIPADGTSPRFRSVGIRASDAEELRAVIIAAARDAEAEPGVANVYGQRYVVDFEFSRH